MATILGTPVVQQPADAIEVVQLQIVTRPEEWQQLFDRIEVWRSTSSPSGPFFAMTAPAWVPAILPVTAGPAADITGPTVLLAGMQLLLRVDGTDDFVVTFTSSDPITLAQAAAVVIAQSSGRFSAYVDGNGHFVLTGTRPGTGGSLAIMGGDAAPVLGLPTGAPDNLAYGRDAHIALLPQVQQYTFTDLRGSKTYFYRTRFLNSMTSAASEFSTSYGINQSLGITPVNVVVGFVELVGTDGRPLPQQLVQIYAPTQRQLVEGKLVTGPRQAKVTDINGYTEFTLVRGVRYTVSVTGTDLVREFVAPSDPTVTLFSLFDQTVGSHEDLFRVDRPTLEYAERRSL